MSEAIQRRAREFRDAALARAQAAGERAERNRADGNSTVAHRLEESAEHQLASAAAAERLRVLDVSIDGNQLPGEPNGYRRPQPGEGRPSR